MKFIFIALAYFSFGFAFPNFSPILAIVLGFLLLLSTIILVFNLFDDRMEEVWLEQ